MKYFIQTLILTIVISTAMAQNTFEGVIELQTVNNSINDKATVKWLIKDGNHKLEINGTTDGKAYQSTMLLSAGSTQAKILTNINGQKAVYTVPESSLKADQTLSESRVVESEETLTIAGYQCTKVELISPQGVTTCWVTTETGLTLEQFPAALRSQGVIKQLQANNIQGIPLSITSTGQNGELLFSQKVLKVQETSVSDQEFEIGSGYQSGEKLLKESIEVE